MHWAVTIKTSCLSSDRRWMTEVRDGPSWGRERGACYRAFRRAWSRDDRGRTWRPCSGEGGACPRPWPWRLGDRVAPLPSCSVWGCSRTCSAARAPAQLPPSSAAQHQIAYSFLLDGSKSGFLSAFHVRWNDPHVRRHRNETLADRERGMWQEKERRQGSRLQKKVKRIKMWVTGFDFSRALFMKRSGVECAVSERVESGMDATRWHT